MAKSTTLSLSPVKLTDLHRVTPEPSPPAKPFSLPLTFFDTFWIKLPPVERIFLYQIPNLSPLIFRSNLLPNLLRSLSLTLHHFLPVAGNLTWPSESAVPVIVYTPGDAVSVTVAESTGDFDRLAGDGVREAADSLPYVPEFIASESTAIVLSLQLTFFPGRGFSIGVSSHHGVVDGKTQALFVKAWAHICKQIGNDEETVVSLPDFLTPVFDRSRTRIENSDEIAVEYLNNWFQFGLKHPGMTPNLNRNPRSLELLWSIMDSKNLRATFNFSKQRINQLREAVILQSGKPNFHFSSFVLTLAYTLVCIVKAKGLRGDETIQAGFTADFRSRLDPPAPDTYFGNCVAGFDVVLSAAAAAAGGVSGVAGVAYAAGRLAETVEELERGVMVGAKERLAKLLFPETDQFVVGVAGSPRLGMYEVDFGYGRPRKVEIASTARTGAVSMAESGDGSGGVEVGVVLKREEMEGFCAAFNDGFDDC
ncbi:Malonyl-CoA:anthocyanidin 5-O-glucoside-6''-O-malonyltransferase [Linum perenne]